MRWSRAMSRMLRIKIAFLFLCFNHAESRERSAYMLFSSACLAIGPRTEMIAPMVDGEPDIVHAKVSHLIYKPSCGVIKIQ